MFIGLLFGKSTVRGDLSCKRDGRLNDEEELQVAKKSKKPNTRQKAARRTAAGRFTRVIFNKIGGRECKRFAAMTWVERDRFMKTPEGAAVKARYLQHLASLQ
jgi:hypothetical protein